ncbi:hypothetical protein LINGRAHAP2_LOCUS15112 [Linum grandiflorum]
MDFGAVEKVQLSEVEDRLLFEEDDRTWFKLFVLYTYGTLFKPWSSQSVRLDIMGIFFRSDAPKFNLFKEFNWCQFLIQITKESGIGKKNYVEADVNMLTMFLLDMVGGPGERVPAVRLATRRKSRWSGMMTIYLLRKLGYRSFILKGNSCKTRLMVLAISRDIANIASDAVAGSMETGFEKGGEREEEEGREEDERGDVPFSNGEDGAMPEVTVDGNMIFIMGLRVEPVQRVEEEAIKEPVPEVTEEGNNEPASEVAEEGNNEMLQDGEEVVTGEEGAFGEDSVAEEPAGEVDKGAKMKRRQVEEELYISILALCCHTAKITIKHSKRDKEGVEKTEELKALGREDKSPTNAPIKKGVQKKVVSKKPRKKQSVWKTAKELGCLPDEFIAQDITRLFPNTASAELLYRPGGQTCQLRRDDLWTCAIGAELNNDFVDYVGDFLNRVTAGDKNMDRRCFRCGITEMFKNGGIEVVKDIMSSAMDYALSNDLTKDV